MKQKSFLPAFILAILLLGCNKSGKAYTRGEKSWLTNETAAVVVEATEDILPDSIDLRKLTFSEKELPAFPIFSPPSDIATLNKPIMRDFDRLFFPTRDGMASLEGKVYKTFLTNVTGKEWSLPYFEKSYKDQIIAAGGVLLFQGKVAVKELDHIKDEATYFGEEGSIDYPNNPVKVYAIRKKEGDHIFVQISGNTAGAAIQILQLPKLKK